jgi:flagellar hook protein FlgE
MGDFSIPLSGLTANSAVLSAISNNLANLNTIGYKESRATFRDLFYQTLGSTGSGDPIQVGAGTAVGSLTTVFSGGSIDQSGVPTDVAIMGDGFFVVEKNGNYNYTRAGNFQVGDNGTLMTEDGQTVMGYPATSGVIPSGQSLGPLQLGQGQISPPSATTSLQLGANLDASAAIGDSWSTSMDVYDSLGGDHVLKLTFTKTASNQWSYDASLPSSDLNVTPATDASGNPLPVPMEVSLASGTLSFDNQGNLSQVDGSSATKSVVVNTTQASSSPAPPATTIGIGGLSDGAASLSMTWNLFDSTGKNGTLTQMSSTSGATATSQDGYGAGSLTDFSIDNDGVIQGSFSNDKTMVLGQIALASFPNSLGLSRLGQNNFASTLSSGSPVIGTPGTGGRGSVAGGALELSNVDIASEFSRMIEAQRGFQANARAITTFDDIAQETINLKRT